MEEKVRFNAPYNFKCAECGGIIEYNKRFNAKKLGNKEYKILCPFCKHDLVFIKKLNKFAPGQNILLINEENIEKDNNDNDETLQQVEEESSEDYYYVDVQHNIEEDESSSYEPFSPPDHRLIFKVKLDLKFNENE